ncbi:hypothetical protein DTO013F2_10324 [Penicillium roqueforti]|nr:hypothetical protein DTO013F2_10324 [Penicillium roqueforti]
MSTKLSDHGQTGEEAAESPNQRFPKVEYNQPQFSLYELPMATLSIGTTRYSIPSFYLQKYPLFEDRFLFEDLRLSGVPEDIGHTLVHFLSTGAYETIDSPLGERLSYVEREYKRSVQVYHTCRKYGLPDLEALAEKYIEYFGKAMTTVELINSTREAFFLLPEDEIWLPKYVKKVLRRELVTEKSPLDIRDIAKDGTGKKSELFGTAVMAAVIDILYIQVQHCVKTHKGHLNSLEVEGDTEPEHVAASDAGTGEYVVWPEGPAAAEADVVVNGLPITPDERAVDDHPGSFAQAPICDPDDLKGSPTEDADQIFDCPSDDFADDPAECPAEDLAPCSVWHTAAFPANNARIMGWTGVPYKPFAYVPCYEEAAPEEPTPDENVPEPLVYEDPVDEEAVPDEPVPDEDAVPDEPVPDEDAVPEEAIAQEPVAEVITDQASSDSPLVPNSSLLANDSNLVARSKQLHYKSHFATCFKYRPTDRSKSTCRFGMPRENLPSSKIDDLGVIHLARNHPWVNPWNPSIASCLRSNHDISLDTDRLKIMIAKGALLKQAIEKAKTAVPPTATDLRLRERDMDNFALRCFNSLAHEREVSGVQVASTLLHLPSYYTVNSKFVRVNLWWLRHYVSDLRRQTGTDHDSSAGIADEPCAFQTGDVVPVSLFDNYKWRGFDLAAFSLFEYCMLVQIRKKQRNRSDHFDFDPSHPKGSACFQHVARAQSQIATVTFDGQLTQCQTSEDSIRGGHPMTDAIANDLAEIFLGLFVPWENLRDIFLCEPHETDFFSRVWSSVKPTLAPHIQEFAANIELLRKSKEDCQVDARLRQTNHPAEVSDRHIDHIDSADLDPEDAQDDGSFITPEDERFTAETLIAAYHTVSKTWGRDCFIAAKRAPVLAAVCRAHASAQINPLPSVLRDWETRLASHKKPFQDDGPSQSAVAQLQDLDLADEDGVLQPVLTNASLSDDIPARPVLLENPTPDSLTTLVGQDIPLNTKQVLVVRKLLTEIMMWADRPYDSSRRKQLLLCITGEGGTGAAADNLGGNTYHTSLGINLSYKAAVSIRVRRLWAQKTILVIDEMSMVDLKVLSVINNQCKVARSLPRSSPELFGGLPIVILMGDFFQFPPVHGPPLWKKPRYGNDDDAAGRLIWRRFENVIILNEQMRQSEDPSFRDFLTRTRHAALTEDDVIHLNSKSIFSLTDSISDNAVVIAKLIQSTESPDHSAQIPFPGLLTYTRDMPTVMLTNACTPLGQVNGAKVTAVGVALDPAGKSPVGIPKIN